MVRSNFTYDSETYELLALARVAPYMCLEKRKRIMKTFVVSQFRYYPLVWMFHGRSLNNEINSFDERALRMTHCVRSSLFQDLLKNDNSVFIHHRNIQTLATAMFKVKNNSAPEIMKEIFASKMSTYPLRVLKMVCYSC